MSNQYEKQLANELLNQIENFRNELSGFEIVLEEKFDIENVNELKKYSVVKLQEVVDYFEEVT